MPRLKLILPKASHSWTKVPNQLFDRLLPTLKDTELRILLILLRQTNGWNREGAVTILSYRTLIDKTGRSSEAISRALSALQAKGLIHRPRPYAKSGPRKAN